MKTYCGTKLFIVGIYTTGKASENNLYLVSLHNIQGFTDSISCNTPIVVTGISCLISKMIVWMSQVKHHKPPYWIFLKSIRCLEQYIKTTQASVILAIDWWVTSESCHHDEQPSEKTAYSLPYPDSKIHGTNVGPTWGRQDPGWPHVGHTKLAIWVDIGVVVNRLRGMTISCDDGIIALYRWE